MIRVSGDDASIGAAVVSCGFRETSSGQCIVGELMVGSLEWLSTSVHVGRSGCSNEETFEVAMRQDCSICCICRSGIVGHVRPASVHQRCGFRAVVYGCLVDWNDVPVLLSVQAVERTTCVCWIVLEMGNRSSTQRLARFLAVVMFGWFCGIAGRRLGSLGHGSFVNDRAIR